MSKKYRKHWEGIRLLNALNLSPASDDTGYTFIPSPSAERFTKYQMQIVFKKKGPRKK